MSDTVAVVWDDDGAGRGPSPRRWKPATLVAAIVVIGLIAVPVVIAANRDPGHPEVVRLGNRGAEKTVLAALDAMTDAGSYDMTYSARSTPATAPATIRQDQCVTTDNNGQTMTICNGQGGGSGSQFVDVDGRGTVSLDPYAELTVSSVGGYGEITLRTDGTRVWEYGGADYGTTPGPTGVEGNSLSNFAGLVVSTLGVGPGALSLIGLANPAGYLQLERESIAHAAPAGTGSVDGVDVTYYRVTVDLTKILDTPGLSAEQSRTIAAALKMLDSVHYLSTQEKIGIGPDGFIREATVVSNFADGSTMTRVTKLTNFGCAGTVLMPGETAPPTTTAPPRCTGATTTAPTTTTVAPTTTTFAPTTTTFAPPTTTAGTTTTDASTTANSPTSTSLAPTTTIVGTATSVPGGTGR